MNPFRQSFLFWATVLSTIPAVVILRNLLVQMGTWPLTDLVTHATKLHFFETVGYAGVTQQWNYGVGYALFATYPPAYFFLTFPIVKILSVVNVNAPIIPAMMVSVFVLLALLTYAIYRLIFKNILQSILLVTLVFFNPLTINWIFETGRLPELTGWVVFIPIFGLMLRHFNEKLSIKKLAVLGVLFSILMISHPAVFTMSLLAWGVFSILTFSKNGFKTALPMVIGIGGSVWWLLPYFTAKKDLLLSSYVGFHLETTYIFTNFFHAAAVLLLLALSYLAWRQKHTLYKWWAAMAGLGVLTLLSIPRFIPFFNQPHQVTYATFLFFIAIHGLISLDWNKVSFPLQKYFKIAALLFILAMSTYSSIKFFDFAEKKDIHTLYGDEIDVLGNHISDPFTCYPECGGELSYWVVHDGRSTTDNFSPEATPITIAQSKSELGDGIAAKNCSLIETSLSKLKVNTVVAASEYCNTLSACGMDIFQTAHWCIATQK